MAEGLMPGVMAIMSDDVQRVLGRLEAVTEAIIGRVDRSDALTAQRFKELADSTEANKQAAIVARAENHEENRRAIKDLQTAMDGTAVMARDHSTWIDTIGKPLVTRVDNIHDRVTAMEDGRRLADAEERGSLKTWGLIGAGISGLIGVAGWLGWDSIKAALERYH